VDYVEDNSKLEKEMELNEREAVLLTRERVLEQRIREILRREQHVAVKEERIEALLRELQSMGLHELAAGLEDTFQDALTELEERRARQAEQPPEAESMADGGTNGQGLWGKSVEMRETQGPISLELIDELELDPEAKTKRFLEELERDLEHKDRGDMWDRADRMRYLAITFQEAGNYQKSAEYARRALIILGHFS
jgi:hypothetical protein